MPFKSKAQRRLFYAKMRAGEIEPETVKKWSDETPKNIPERKKMNKSAELIGIEYGMEKAAAKKKDDKWGTYGAMAAIPFAAAGTGAALKGMVNWSAGKGVAMGMRRGAGIGGAIGMGTLGLIGMSKMLNKADPSGQAFEAALRLAPAALAVGGAMSDDRY